MVFNSLVFVLFLAAVVALDRALSSWRARKAMLLLASYLFYAAWNPPFVVLIWISTLVDWFAARRMARSERPAARRALICLSLAANLGLLGFFKYGDFLLEQFQLLAWSFGVDYAPPALDIVLPVGISFYTFQTLSYTLDVYRRRLEPSPSFLDFALFVTFFPQLVAGPIVRAAWFLPQCRAPRRATARELSWGGTLVTVGLFAKVILADGILSPVADQVFAAPASAGFREAWLGTLAFSGQIFFDFSGYSACAIGAAMSLGYALPDNFRYPYAAIGFSDFWRRWHVSLSTWLRDYLYISLGGNRRGTARTQANLMITMLLGGLWHGAAWSFVLWGALHGAYLVAERGVRGLWGSRPAPRTPVVRFGLALGTYAVVCFTWVFFRAESLADARTLVAAMLGGGSGDLFIEYTVAWLVLGVNAGLVLAHWLLRDSSLEQAAGRLPPWLRAALLAGMLAGLALAPGDSRGFIYFQF